jgi:hypothetical protein
MTTPHDRTLAVLQTKEFLEMLCSLDGVLPLTVVVLAEGLLRHYPTLLEIEAAHKGAPEVFGPVPPYQKIGFTEVVQGVLDAARDAGGQL